MNTKHLILIIAMILITNEATSSKQTDSSLAINHIDTNKIQPIPGESPKSIASPFMTLTKSPTNAILWSLLIPGAGQIYVESYWKAPIFALGAATCIYFAIDNNKKYSIYQNEYDRLDPEMINYQTQKRILSLKKEYYRDNRDKSFFYLAGVYILAAIDAYVGAHLYDFSVSDDLSFNFIPINNGIYLSLSIRF